MRILFVVNRLANVRHFDRAIRLLADRGHEISLAAQEDDLEVPEVPGTPGTHCVGSVVPPPVPVAPEEPPPAPVAPEPFAPEPFAPEPFAPEPLAPEPLPGPLGLGPPPPGAEISPVQPIRNAAARTVRVVHSYIDSPRLEVSQRGRTKQAVP